MKATEHLRDERLNMLKGAVTRLAVGFFILLIGAIMLLRQVGVIQNRITIDLWPVVLVIFGLRILVAATYKLKH